MMKALGKQKFSQNFLKKTFYNKLFKSIFPRQT